jgi:hypothetical protein
MSIFEDFKQKGGFHSPGVISLTPPKREYRACSLAIRAKGSPFISSTLNFISGIKGIP